MRDSDETRKTVRVARHSDLELNPAPSDRYWLKTWLRSKPKMAIAPIMSRRRTALADNERYCITTRAEPHNTCTVCAILALLMCEAGLRRYVSESRRRLLATTRLAARISSTSICRRQPLEDGKPFSRLWRSPIDANTPAATTKSFASHFPGPAIESHRLSTDSSSLLQERNRRSTTPSSVNSLPCSCDGFDCCTSRRCPPLIVAATNEPGE